MKAFSLLFFLIIFEITNAQKNEYYLELIQNFDENQISCWNIDAFENLILADQSSLKKINSNGQTTYKVSNKSYGELKQIIPITPMKILLFSEQQQQICFLDNTLTQVENCIDLDIYNIDFATITARSGRGDQLWIFDQINSKIILADLRNPGKILQEIRNLKGLIQLEDILNMIEFQSELFILDSENKLSKFDLYGNLLSQEKLEFSQMSCSDNSMWMLKSNQLFSRNDDEMIPLNCFIPIDVIENFRFNDSRFYFQQGNQIQVFNLVKKK
jgi:hypothetical protein